MSSDYDDIFKGVFKPAAPSFSRPGVFDDLFASLDADITRVNAAVRQNSDNWREAISAMNSALQGRDLKGLVQSVTAGVRFAHEHMNFELPVMAERQPDATISSAAPVAGAAGTLAGSFSNVNRRPAAAPRRVPGLNRRPDLVPRGVPDLHRRPDAVPRVVADEVVLNTGGEGTMSGQEIADILTGEEIFGSHNKGKKKAKMGKGMKN